MTPPPYLRGKKDMSRILIILGHPESDSFCGEISRSYQQAAESAGHHCKLLKLGDLEFNPLLVHGYKKRTELEPDLVMAIDEIKRADHLVFVYPTWWGNLPALLKGFIDRTFLPGITFQYRENSLRWDKLLKGKSARLITTMDAPAFYYKLVYFSPGQRAMRIATLNFCGVSPVKGTIFGPVKSSTPEKRDQWLRKAKELGKKGA